MSIRLSISNKLPSRDANWMKMGWLNNVILQRTNLLHHVFPFYHTLCLGRLGSLVERVPKAGLGRFSVPLDRFSHLLAGFLTLSLVLSLPGCLPGYKGIENRFRQVLAMFQYFRYIWYSCQAVKINMPTAQMIIIT
jgi:hypothetical protein